MECLGFEPSPCITTTLSICHKVFILRLLLRHNGLYTHYISYSHRILQPHSSCLLLQFHRLPSGQPSILYSSYIPYLSYVILHTKWLTYKPFLHLFPESLCPGADRIYPIPQSSQSKRLMSGIQRRCIR